VVCVEAEAALSQAADGDSVDGGLAAEMDAGGEHAELSPPSRLRQRSLRKAFGVKWQSKLSNGVATAVRSPRHV
jgi:hypothetical protein